MCMWDLATFSWPMLPGDPPSYTMAVSPNRGPSPRPMACGSQHFDDLDDWDDWDMMGSFVISQNKTLPKDPGPGHWDDSPDPISSLPWLFVRRSSPVPSPAPGVARPCRAAGRSCPRRSEGQSQEGPSRSSGSRHRPATNLAVSKPSCWEDLGHQWRC